MHPDLNVLLELQSEDVAIAAIEERMLELAARVRGLDRECEQIASGIEQAMSAVEVEEKKRRDLQGNLEQHKQLQERNLAQLDQVRKAKEAVAANTQIDLTRKVLAQEESDLRDMSTRIQSLREVAELQQMELADINERQGSARVEIDALRAELDRQLKEARTKREGTAMKVSRPALAKYERIRTRERSGAMYAIRGAACGRCNTAIPLQRRNIIASGRSIEVCEGCGVLLYAAV